MRWDMQAPTKYRKANLYQFDEGSSSLFAKGLRDGWMIYDGVLSGTNGPGVL
jgi:hypothetical protein